MSKKMLTLETWVEEAIKGFVTDPPDSEYQQGYLAALVNAYTETHTTAPMWMLAFLKDQANG